MKTKIKREISADDRLTPKEIVDLILEDRGIGNDKEFSQPSHPFDIKLSSFSRGFEKKIKKVVFLLKKIYEEKKPVVVYMDYDADGITGGAVLWETLYLLGFNVHPYVPDRITEGYGFSEKGIDAVKEKFNPALIISVDHGITAAKKVSYAKRWGIPIVITDHHLKPDKLPDDALAIFHIPTLSGSGVSYFFSKEIFNIFKNVILEIRQPAGRPESQRDPGQARMTTLLHNFKYDYVTLASIGTIADLVPLIGPSRSLVFHGLSACSHTKRHGLLHIMKQAGILGKKITPYEVGFMIAPRINAVGRLRHAIDALRLLCTTDDKRAFELASQVGDTNKKRQDLVKAAVEEAKRKVEKMGKLPKVVALVSDSWHEGIIGLVASKIADKFYRPTIVITHTNGFMKGSARSIPGVHITNFLRDLKKYLIDVGGHQGAAGFTLEKSKLKDFLKQVETLGKKLVKENNLEREITVDVKLPVKIATMELARALENLQPYGVGNPQPVFLSETELVSARLFGKKSEHLRLYVKDQGAPSFPLELIAFSKGEIFTTLKTGMKMKIAFALDIDRWGGTEKLRGRLIFME